MRIRRWRDAASARGSSGGAVPRGRGRSISVLISACALLAFPAAGETQALRCGSRLISAGDPAAKLQRYCGEPESVSTRLEQRGLFVHGRYFPGFLQEVVVEDWTYNFGPNKLMRQVQLVDGIVTEIELLGYGY